MTVVNTLDERLVSRLISGDVIVVAGAGVTKATVNAPEADWAGLFELFIQGHEPSNDVQKKALAKAVFALEQKDDPSEFLGAASKLKEAWDDEFLSWLNERYSRLSELDSAETTPDLINAIGALGCPILTTNFDLLIENTLGLQALVLEGAEVGLGVITGRRRAVLHLHGNYLAPSSMVLDNEGYDRILNDLRAQSLLGTLLTKSLLFVGCGATLDDPNLGSLYKLIKQFATDSTMYHARLKKTDEAGVRDLGGSIRTIEYGDKFSDLAVYLEMLAERAVPAGARPSAGPTTTVVKHVKTIDVNLHLASDGVRITCEALKLNGDQVKAQPDWARLMSVRRLDELLYPQPPLADVSTEETLTTAQLLGNHLLMLHGTEVPKALRNLEATQERSRCRLILDFDDDASEGRLWESLYSKNALTETEPNQAFVARSLGHSIVRRRKSVALANFPKRRGEKLNVLLAVCDPDDTLKAGDVRDSLHQLNALVVQEPVGADSGRRKSVSFSAAEIQNALTTWETNIGSNALVDVVHIIAHVELRQTGTADREPVVNLGRQQLLAENLQRAIFRGRPPRLVLLQLQPAADAAGSSCVLGVAARASKGGIPNVLTVHHCSGGEATRLYLCGLYELIADGERLDSALALAHERYEDMAQGIESLVFPVLYLDVDNADVLAREQVTESELGSSGGSGVLSGDMPIAPKSATEGRHAATPPPLHAGPSPSRKDNFERKSGPATPIPTTASPTKSSAGQTPV